MHVTVFELACTSVIPDNKNMKRCLKCSYSGFLYDRIWLVL